MTTAPAYCAAPDIARARLAGAQQALAQVGLLLGRRVPLRDVGQLLQRAQPEQLEELRARAVEDGAELRATRLFDQPAVEQRRRRRVGAHAADARDLRTRHGLQVGDDRERLGLRGAERRGARAAEQTPRRLLAVGVAGQREAAAELAQPDAAQARRVLLCQQRERRFGRVGVRLRRVGELLDAERIGRQEQQRLERARELAHPATATTASEEARTAISPKLSRCSQSASPRL